jgi:hypothetical protein
MIGSLRHELKEEILAFCRGELGKENEGKRNKRQGEVDCLRRLRDSV